MDQYNIESLNQSHIHQIALIEKECFSDPWSLDSIKGETENPLAVWFVAMDGEILIGYAGMNHVLDEGYINNVAIKQEYRSKGIATRLLKRLISYGEENSMQFISLEVRASNTNAIELYDKQGFKNVGIRKNFYDHPYEDAIIMTNQLK